MPGVRAGAIDLWVEDEGQGDVVLLIMGLGAQLVFWPDELVAGLVARGYRVVRFDNRDVGLSTKLDHLGVPDVRKALADRMLGRTPSAPYRLDHLADDAVALLDALGIDRAHVVGASMGGMVAQLLALRYPQRVITLTSIMSHTGELSHLLVAPRAATALLRPPPRTVAEATESLVETFRAIGTRPFQEERAREQATRHAQRNFHPQGTARQLAAILSAPARTRDLAQLRVPTLVLHGTDDPLVPFRGGRATAAAIRGARLIPYEGMGHDIPRTAWERILRDLDPHLVRR